MRRIARVTEDLGRGAGGFYVDAPDIPEGVTCNEWRARRAQIARDRGERPESTAAAARKAPRRRAFTWPVRRPRLA